MAPRTNPRAKPQTPAFKPAFVAPRPPLAPLPPPQARRRIGLRERLDDAASWVLFALFVVFVGAPILLFVAAVEALHSRNPATLIRAAFAKARGR